MLTERDIANDGIAPIQKSDYRLVADKPAGAYADADARWVATSKPHVVATSARVVRRTDAVALSAATTHEGHEILKREVEKAMKKEMSVAAPSRKDTKSKKQKESGDKILL
ncbi:hypothetical protein [Pontibacter ramchanderi]|uniref:Uncharacterized protein n=1 Tax=Pontibacter ramchanderi TaxID=1179743 RepID=A0A2N3UCL0_9BACT|nr:hypothetical protein [Pontibacter ramchanderi]PKV67107.1 hypothetical protein BD749_2246 [Pontibacter ramchanderi]